MTNDVEILTWAHNELRQGLIGEAAADQQSYLQDGNPAVDHRKEWPETAHGRAEHFQLVVDGVQEQGGGGGLIDQLRQVADDLAGTVEVGS